MPLAGSHPEVMPHSQVISRHFVGSWVASRNSSGMFRSLHHKFAFCVSTLTHEKHISPAHRLTHTLLPDAGVAPQVSSTCRLFKLEQLEAPPFAPYFLLSSPPSHSSLMTQRSGRSHNNHNQMQRFNRRKLACMTVDLLDQRVKVHLQGNAPSRFCCGFK